jgi:hypothetical protein
MSDEQVGTVEILKARVYPLDPEMNDQPLATTVVVDVGTYPLYRHIDAYYWMMTGRINSRGFTKMGDGLFAINDGDAPAGPEVTFPSPRFGPEQWADFIAEPVCTEGHPAQRLRVRTVSPADA